jgi:hypothetical protein
MARPALRDTSLGVSSLLLDAAANLRLRNIEIVLETVA